MKDPIFPDPRDAGEDGIVALGGALTPNVLIEAYRRGIFPWPDPRIEFMIWASPAKRGVLDFSRVRIPRTLAKAARKHPYRFTVDQAFEEVISRCAESNRPGQDVTWITPAMRRAYCKFHELGYAHSIEAWEGDSLAGGLYGVELDGVFSGESMFYLRPNASKLALLHLIELLKTRGATWMDIQVMTPHFEQLGAELISREEFLSRLARTHAQGMRLFPAQARMKAPRP